MEDSKKKSSSEILHGTVFQAGYQENGRGRIKGREWQSSKDMNLTFTVVFKRTELNHDLNLMPLIAGISLTSAVRKITGRKYQLKWPNDLLHKGCKCAGILCEADSEYFYCGMGVNCNQLEFPDSIKQKTVSLKQICHRDIDIGKLLLAVLEQFKFYLGSGDLWRSHLESLLYKKGETVEILEGRADSAEMVKGRIRGIGDDGQLVIDQMDGVVKEIYAGEIEL